VSDLDLVSRVYRVGIAERSGSEHGRCVNMTVAQCFACLISLATVMWFFDRQRTCLRCGGLGGHRRDCPLAEHEEEEH
jgi:hypothetical protein